MLDLRTAPSLFDDTVLVSHVRDLPDAALITIANDADEPITYALVRFDHDVIDDDSGLELPAGSLVLYYADAATTACFAAPLLRTS